MRQCRNTPTATLGSWKQSFKTAFQYTCTSRSRVLAALWFCSKVSAYIAAAVFRVSEATGGSSALYSMSQKEYIKITSKSITVNWNKKPVLRKIQILSCSFVTQNFTILLVTALQASPSLFSQSGFFQQAAPLHNVPVNLHEILLARRIAEGELTAWPTCPTDLSPTTFIYGVNDPKIVSKAWRNA